MDIYQVVDFWDQGRSNLEGVEFLFYVNQAEQLIHHRLDKRQLDKRKIMYDQAADKKQDRYSSPKDLSIFDFNLLPSYIKENNESVTEYASFFIFIASTLPAKIFSCTVKRCHLSGKMCVDGQRSSIESWFVIGQLFNDRPSNWMEKQLLQWFIEWKSTKAYLD